MYGESDAIVDIALSIVTRCFLYFAFFSPCFFYY
jgi:hypothetical protein